MTVVLAHDLGHGLGKAHGLLLGAALDGVRDALGGLLGLGHGLVGHGLRGLLGLLAGLLVRHGLGRLDLLRRNEVVAVGEGVELVRVLVIVGVELLLGVLEGLELLLRVARGDVAAGQQLAHGLHGVALAVVEGDEGLGVAQAVARRGGVKARDDLVYLGLVLGGELVAGLHRLIVERRDLGHVLKGEGLEVVLPGGVLVDALGQVRQIGCGESLLVQVLAGIEEHAQIAAIGVHKAGVGAGVVVLVVGVRVLRAVYSYRRRAAVEQVGVQQNDHDDKDGYDGADYAPAGALLLSLDRRLALCQGLLVGALHALGLASLFVLRCAHWCFILYFLHSLKNLTKSDSHSIITQSPPPFKTNL